MCRVTICHVFFCGENFLFAPLIRSVCFMNCPFCNSEISVPVKFCPECGKSVNTAFQEVLNS